MQTNTRRVSINTNDNTNTKDFKTDKHNINNVVNVR